MPELPEVETVRRGLAERVAESVIVTARTHHPRVARRHLAGPRDLCSRLTGNRILSVQRRGKYLWFPLAGADARATDEQGGVGVGAMLAHLGMSGQFRITERPIDDHAHRRFDAELDDGRWLTFLDQRTFGGIGWDVLVRDDSDTRYVPEGWRHVAADPFESGFDVDAVVADIRRRHSEIKRLLLDQTVVSGIGNIYADESLWRAKVHPQRASDKLSSSTLRLVMDAAREVMTSALAEGGTSFDSLYVDVNGESGYFERSLDVYGREDEPCRRCGAAIRRLTFMNRSSFVCLRCQRPPRRKRLTGPGPGVGPPVSPM
ncbi:MAG TPA: bifunctional DNA-formamidopyrimidine glycosylase/DNA-(apurinic or apyrimidinic site) lyase [Actinomycetes bacterium]|nr:bifunctional DNA-formamidopyrimidine glycosylase/DNA-(apurinic or apyrimidinic site) lyase [Actinomycetes bacterium]